MASQIPTAPVAPAAPAAEALGSIEALFQALADRTRLRILALLLTGEVCVCDIHESLELPQPKVSRHLAYLRRAGLVDGRKQGLWVHYRVANLTDPILRTIQDAVTHALSHVDELQQDTVRLAKRQNCAPLQPGAAPQCVCCSGTQGVRLLNLPFVPASDRGPDPVQVQSMNRVRAGRQQR